MPFQIKNILKSNRNHIYKHPRKKTHHVIV